MIERIVISKKNKKCNGLLYCFTNPIFNIYGKNVFKCGKTSRTGLERIKDFTTAYLENSVLLCEIYVDDIHLGEKLLFNKIDKYRMTDNREFFQCEIKIIENIMRYVSNVLDPSLDINDDIILNKDVLNKNILNKDLLNKDVLNKNVLNKDVSVESVNFNKQHNKIQTVCNNTLNAPNTPDILDIPNTFKCDCCNFESLRKYDLNRHYKTKRHVINSEEIKQQQIEQQQNQHKVYKCKCGRQFNNSGNLYRHRKRCENEWYDSKNVTIHITQNEPNSKKTVISRLKRDYKKSPPLKILKNSDISNILKYMTSTSESIEDIILSQYSKFIFHKFIGNIIIEKYKKGNIYKQQIWSVDISRLKFAISDKDNT